MSDRAQAYTLEGVVGAILILTAVIYGLQAVDVGPWTGGSDREAVERLRTQARDVLDAAADAGALRRAVTCVDRSDFGRRNRTLPADAIGSRNATASPTVLGPMLDETLYRQGHRYNLYVSHPDGSTGRTPSERHLHPERIELAPGPEAVTVTRRVTLYDTTAVTTASSGCTDAWDDLERVGNETYLGPDAVNGSSVYTVVEVKLVVW